MPKGQASHALLALPPRFEELTNLIRTIRNAMKIRDVTKCLEEFELLGKAYGKAKSIVDKEGVPRFYIRILADLGDYLNEVGCHVGPSQDPYRSWPCTSLNRVSLKQEMKQGSKLL